MSIDLQIDTYIDGHMIHQTTTGPGRHPITNAREVLSRRVIDTSDAQVRAKLIELGWAPPKVSKPQEVRMYILIPSPHGFCAGSYARIEHYQEARKKMKEEAEAAILEREKVEKWLRKNSKRSPKKSTRKRAKSG